MNYLAHALLAAPDATDMAANLIGEFVRGRLQGRFPPQIEAGIRLHRRIDSWTDAHPLHRQSRARMTPPYRRFAGILVDVYYDHFLARHFQRYSEEPLAAFAQRVYRALASHRQLLPPRLRRFAGHMESRDLLTGYAELAVIEETLIGMGKRFKRDNPLSTGILPLRANYRALEVDFLQFFPQLVAWVDKQAIGQTVAPDPGSS